MFAQFSQQFVYATGFEIGNRGGQRARNYFVVLHSHFDLQTKRRIVRVEDSRLLVSFSLTYRRQHTEILFGQVPQNGDIQFAHPFSRKFAFDTQFLVRILRSFRYFLQTAAMETRKKKT